MNDVTGLFEQVSRNRWENTRPIELHTRFGDFVIPERTRSDLFSVVPNTEHPELWIAAHAHDYLRAHRKELGLTRHQTDLIFRDEMLVQSHAVFVRLRETEGLAAALDENYRLVKVTFVYYRGVAGVLGTLYMVLGELF